MNVHLTLLSGSQPPKAFQLSRFPAVIGREPAADLVLEEPGVWERHLSLEFRPAVGFFLRSRPEAFSALNSQPFQETQLRNGDLIEIGTQKLQFTLPPARQKNLRWSETVTWLSVLLSTIVELYFLIWLLN